MNVVPLARHAPSERLRSIYRLAVRDALSAGAVCRLFVAVWHEARERGRSGDAARAEQLVWGAYVAWRGHIALVRSMRRARR